jgi:thioredoxin-like negative regulator of GroEL
MQETGNEPARMDAPADDSGIPDTTGATWLCVYFSHDECNVCKTLRPKVAELLQSFPEVTFRYINTKKDPAAAGQHLVFAVPTIIIFYEGKEVRRFGRYVSLSEMESFFNRAFT